MPDTANLEQFIEAAKGKGASDEALVQLLQERGWPQKEIYRALSSYYEELTGMSVPARGSGAEAPKDAFLYLLSFATLATWATALGSLLFTLLDLWISDPLARSFPVYPSPSHSIATQMACIIVAFPIYVWVLRLLARELSAHPEKVRSGVRKWLSYLALFLAAGCVISDLITFLAFFLRGELTARFLLKVTVVLVIAGGIFWYYLTSLREGSDDAAL